jgi:hypothetical protein
VTWVGIDKAMLENSNLPQKLRRGAIGAAAVKVLLPVKGRAKSIFISHEKVTEDSYSKARQLARSLVIRRLKDKRNPGARVVLKAGKMGVGRRNWPIWKYGRLFAFGAKGKRSTRETGANRGSFGGFGDPVLAAGDSAIATMDNQFGEAIKKIIEKEMGSTRPI